MDGSVLHELRIGRRTSLLLVAEGGDRPRRLDKHRGHACAGNAVVAVEDGMAVVAVATKHVLLCPCAPLFAHLRRLLQQHWPPAVPARHDIVCVCV